MPSKFQTLKAKAYRDQMLSMDYFAEQVAYVAGYGAMEEAPASAALAAAWAAPITVSVSQPKGETLYEDGVHRIDAIEIQCCRDPAAQNSDGDNLRGIEKPGPTDAIVRAADRDPAQLPYFFTEIKHETDTVWLLVFERRIVHSVGHS